MAEPPGSDPHVFEAPGQSFDLGGTLKKVLDGIPVALKEGLPGPVAQPAGD